MENQVEIFEEQDGLTEIEVKFKGETIWLNQKQLSELFDKDSDTIGLHIKKYLKKGSL
jgi:hypothetical protein